MDRPSKPASLLKQRYLRVEDLRRLRHLIFTSKRTVEGQYAGRHASLLRGQAVEFSDYREYTSGDEIGDIDWKVYGRSDKLFIKLFEHHTDMTIHLLVDGSASMKYRGYEAQGKKQGARAQQDKYDHACMLAAAIAFLVINNQDKVAFGIAQNGLANFQPPSGTHAHLNRILGSMVRVTPRRQADLALAIEGLAQRTRRKGIFVLFSDLLESREEILRALSMFKHRGSQVIVFQVMHPDELELPELHEAVFVDSETNGKIRLNVDDVRPAYRKRLNAFLDGWAGAFRARQIDYNLVSTVTPYNKALESYLVRRASRT